MPPAKVPTLFKCVKCGKEYSKIKSFRLHMETHSGKVHECDECEKKYTHRSGLRAHRQTAHADAGQLECDQCGKICPHKKALSDHKRRAHSDHEFECQVCGKKVILSNSSRHMKTHTGQSCECDVCGKVCPNSGALASHKRHAHLKAQHRCEQCGKSFRWASVFRRPMATHNDKREEFQCSRCPRKFKTPEGREKHMRIEHSDTRFTCDADCGLHSATRSEYLEHLTSRHAKQHPVTCKCLSVDSPRAQKVATHLGNTAFVEADGTMKCFDGDCDFTSTCARQMESHKEQCHHDAYQPVLRCGICESWFSSPGSLRSHNASKHQGDRRFKCADCGYITNFKGAFTRHQTNCRQGKALGNRKLKRGELTAESLHVKKESPHNVYQFGSKVYEAVKKGENPPVKYAIKEVGPKGGKSAELEAKRMRQFEHKASCPLNQAQ